MFEERRKARPLLRSSLLRGVPSSRCRVADLARKRSSSRSGDRSIESPSCDATDRPKGTEPDPPFAHRGVRGDPAEEPGGARSVKTVVSGGDGCYHGVGIAMVVSGEKTFRNRG